jgi:monoamine oxidase
MSSSVIIIGAGAAGLQAGRRLSAAGHRVILLEAAAEPGGRILYLTPKGFSVPVEGGAEFIHGSLPLSLGLMQEAGILLQPVKAQMVRWMNGVEEDSGGVLGADWGELMRAMAALTEDQPVAGFLARHFGGERYERLRESVRRFAEGYDLADPERVSTLSLYREWSEEMGEEEWRPVGGYRRMIDFLVEQCRRQGAVLYCNSAVTAVSWEKGRVVVTTAGGPVFTAGILVVAVPLGVLQTGGIRFHPALPEMDGVLRRLGYGSVIKILLEFKQAFWLDKKLAEQTLFILSDQAIPTWWTQTGEEDRLLTGWLAGEKMRHFQQLDESGQMACCLRSLAAIFARDEGWLREELAASLVLDWSGMPFVKGGYSFETVGSAEARGLLSRPFGKTIYFCGEALYEGEAPGTVEAALKSGWDVAEKILSGG